MEKARRSIVKAMTFRLLATVMNVIIIFLVFEDLRAALGIGVVEFFLKFGLYYVHERVWSRIKWGRKNMCSRFGPSDRDEDNEDVQITPSGRAYIDISGEAGKKITKQIVESGIYRKELVTTKVERQRKFNI